MRINQLKERHFKASQGLHGGKRTKKQGIFDYFSKFSAETPPEENNEESLEAPYSLFDHSQLINEWLKPTNILAHLSDVDITGKRAFQIYFLQNFLPKLHHESPKFFQTSRASNKVDSAPIPII